MSDNDAVTDLSELRAELASLRAEVDRLKSESIGHTRATRR